MKPIKNFCLPHKLGLVMSDASAEVPFLHNEFQPDIETLFRFISNSAVRHDAMAKAFKDLELQEVAMIGAFFTRWLSHGRCAVNLHKGLPGLLTGLRTIVDNKTDADCAQANGLLCKWGSFRHIATVALMLDVLEPVDIYKKQLQTREQTHAQNMAQYHACRASLEHMQADVMRSPALLQFVDLMKTGAITSAFCRELDGIDRQSDNFEKWLGGRLLSFQDEVRYPFISGILRGLSTRIMDETMQMLCALDRIVLPADILEMPARFVAYKKQLARLERKKEKEARIAALEVKVAKLREASSEDEAQQGGRKHEEIKVSADKRTPAQPATQIELPHFEFCVSETKDAATAFTMDLALVAKTLELSSQDIAQAKAEHVTWRSFLLDAQSQLIQAGSSNPLKTVLDVHKSNSFRVNSPSVRYAFPMHTLLLDISATNLETSVEPERGFSFMNATKTDLRANLAEKQLDSLMIVGLHSPPVVGADTSPDQAASLSLFLDKCMFKWDSLKARRCRSVNYNDNPNKQPVQKPREKRARQGLLAQSGFAKLARLRAEEQEGEGDAELELAKLGAEEDKEGIQVESEDETSHDDLTVPSPPKAIIPRQKHLTDYFNQSIATARENAETLRKEVAAHRQAKKVKTHGKKKAPSKASDQPPAENVRGLARWLDGAERRDKDLSEGIMVTVVSGARPGSRLRKVVVSASSVA